MQTVEIQYPHRIFLGMMKATKTLAGIMAQAESWKMQRMIYES
jgi:hypothetical protein